MTQDAPLSVFWLRTLSVIGSVRPAERRDTLGAFLTLLGFMAGHALLETARDALFLAELPVSLLPWVYLTLAASALVLTRYHAYLARYFRRGQELNVWLVFAGLVTAALWLAIFWAGDWIFYVLYAWSGILATLIVVRFWTMLGDRFTVTQAKRLFAVIGSGSVIGAIVGSGLARILTESMPAQHLVLFAGLAFLASSFGPLLLSAPAAPSARPQQTVNGPADLRRVGRLIWARPYLLRVAMTILLATVTFTLIDFVFKSTVARLVPDDQLGEFFASVYFTLNILSLGVQLVAVSWVLRRVGVNVALAIVPTVLLLGSIGFIVSGGLAAVLLLKGSDGSMRYSLYRTTTELLFVPISAEVRGRVKTFIDVLGQRGGQALGSLLVLLVLTVTASETAIAVVAAAAAGVWLYLVVQLKPHYLDVFRQTLREGITATRIEFPALDVASLETLLATLNSPDDRRVIAALDLLAGQNKLRVVPGLILYHPSPPVVIHALELFSAAGRDDVLPLVDRLLSDPNEKLRVASLRARATLHADETILRTAVGDPSFEVRATAMVGLASRNWMSPREARAELDGAVKTGDLDTMLATARAIRALATPKFNALLLKFTTIEDTAVQLETIRAIRVLKDAAFTSALIGLLPRRAIRDEARATLVSLGPTALEGMATKLGDPNLAHAVRRHLPRAIAAFGTPRASIILLNHLLEESDGMIRFKILRALGKLRTNNPRLPLDHRAIEQALEQNVNAAFRFMRWKHALESKTATVPGRLREHHEILVGLLRDKQAHTLERLFRLLNLQANDEEFLRIYRGLHSPKREARAGSRELIEHVVQPPVRRSMLTLVDDLYDVVGVGSPNDDSGRFPRYEDVLGELLASGIQSVSSFAAHQAKELRLVGLGDSLGRIKPLSPAHAAVLKDAADALRRASAGTSSRG